MAAFAGQFVPLKINSNGSPEWSKWSRRYKHDGNSIPILYVVRADGKMLYGRSGMLAGAALPQMLLAVLNQSGRRYSDAELQQLEQLVPAAKEAVANGQSAKAALAFTKLKSLGKPGAFGSFATAAIEADELAGKLVEEAKKKIAAADETIDAEKADFQTLLDLTEVKDVYGAFSGLSTDASRALKKIKGSETLKAQLSQAEALQRARRYAMAESAVVKRKATSAFERVIQRYPDTEAARIAAAELKQLGVEAKVASAKSEPDKSPTENEKRDGFRQWSDKSGKFKVVAKLTTVGDDEVVLVTKEGKKVKVALDRLSDADRKFLQSIFDDL